ncbi:MAG TPA: efflux RND transporter periplasmic adaptor subunit [Acidisarcina sp.]
MWWNFRPKATADPNGSQAMWVMPEVRNISTDVTATGTVKLKTGAEVRVGSQLSGIVRRLNVTVGSRVTKGEVIAEIDSRPLMAKIDQANTQLAQANVSLAKAQTDYTRAQKLFDAGLIPAQQFDDARAGLGAAEAAVTAASSSVTAARVDLAYVEIHAPISGTVASIATQQGETVAASFATPTFMTIIQQEALEVVALVDEADIGNVRRGERVAFTTETYPDHEFTGTVTRIAPVATILSGVVNYEVAVSIDGDIAMLKPDMTANVNIRTAEHRALLVPAKSIHRDSGQSFVYVQSATGGSLKRTVSVASRVAEQTEIVRGLAPNEKVQLKTGEATP